MTQRQKTKKKVHQIKSRVSIETTKQDIDRVMQELGIANTLYKPHIDLTLGHAALEFVIDDVHYIILSKEQMEGSGKQRRTSARNNLRAIYHLVHSRSLNIRKGVESLSRAFDGYINWDTTPKLPKHTFQGLSKRLNHPLELPPPRQ